MQSIVSTRTTLPILSNVLVKAEEGQLWLTTTDLEVSVRTGGRGQGRARQGGTTLPARRIFSIFRELPASEIEIDVDDKDVATIQSRASYLQDHRDSRRRSFRRCRSSRRQAISLDQGVFKDMLQTDVLCRVDG